MTKHKRTKKRNQKGGAWYNPISWFSEREDPYGQTIVDNVTEATNNLVSKTDTLVGNAANNVTQGAKNMSNSISSTILDLTSKDPQRQPEPQRVGGKKRRRSRSMKGGKGGLGLTYYAAPVSGLKVAEPTSLQYYANGTNQYSVKGGSKKSRRTRRHKKH